LNSEDIDAIADELIDAYDNARTLAPIAPRRPGFDVAVAYDVLHRIESRRRAQGWESVGRKIGFTNRTIWPRYGVYQPMWAHVWTNTVQWTHGVRASLALSGFVQPRIEPEVVFGLRGSVPVAGSAREILESVDWVAPGFEIVQSHFPDWKFDAADCTASCGLHGALVVGPAVSLDAKLRDALAPMLAVFDVTLSHDGEVVDRGRGSNVLDSPALALAHLSGVLARQPQFPSLAAGELVTTGTLTDAWPVAPGQRWRSHYGDLGLPGVELTFQ